MPMHPPPRPTTRSATMTTAKDTIATTLGQHFLQLGSEAV